ncbi:MAG: hypothetical protein JNM56_11560 [Planctomycetia bacterium]|nr:hypothetical protein [Planctomycetia bacterium]
MTIKVRNKKADPQLKQIVEVLRLYQSDHPDAAIEVYRHSSVSVRIRILDPNFKRMDRAEREDELWQLFERLPEEVVAEITLLLLLTPDEAKKSFANMEFDNPVPSRL